MICREVRRVVSVLTAAVYLYASTPAFAQGGPPPIPTVDPAKKQFGFYHELELDMEVKVQSGNIRIYRSWEGDKKQWSINPQQENLDISEETEGEAYGHALAKEISRGPRNFKQQGGSWINTAVGGGGGGGGGANPSPQVIGKILSDQINYCTNEGEKQTESLRVGQDGIKWISGIGRQWAQFGFDGILKSWGLGNYRIGQVVLDANNKPSGYSDTFDNQVITFTRDEQGRITKITDSDGREIRYTYNTEGLIEDFIDADGVTTHYQYLNGNIVLKKIGDATGAPPGEEVNDQTTLTFTYFSTDGELKSIQTLDGTQIEFQYEYNQANKLYVTTEFASGNRTTRTTRKEDDGIISVERNGESQIRVDHLCEDTAITDEHNRVTYVDRDALGYIRQVSFPDGRKMLYEHTTANWPEVGQSWNGATAPWGLIRLTLPSGRLIEYERDEMGQVRKAIEHMEDGSATRYWSFKYDAGGNVTEQRLQKGPTEDDENDLITRSTYDLRGNVTSYNIGITSIPWTYTYDGRGNVTKATSPNGKSWFYTYTKRNDLKSYIDPRGYKQNFEYSKRGLLRVVKETFAPGQEAITKFTYNHRGLVTKVQDPLGNNWLYEYDGAGELQIATDPQGNKVQYSYDPRGRVKSTTDGNGVLTTVDYFDTAPVGQAPQTSFAFAPRVHIHYPTYTTELQYNLADNPLFQIMRPNNGAPEQVSYEYDTDDRPTAVVRPDGLRMEYTWDQLSRMTSMSAPGVGTTTFEYPNNSQDFLYHDAIGGTVAYKFNARGLLKSETRPDGTQVNFEYNVNGDISSYINAKGQRISFIYDDALEVITVELYATVQATEPVRSVNYTRDLSGDIISMSDGEFTQSYTRDPLGRVVSASTSYSPTITKSHSYTYTPNGLPATQTAPDGTQYSYLWDANDNFQGLVIPEEGSITLAYDQLNGDQPTQIQFPGGSKQLFSYNDLRQLKQITSQDAAGNPILNRNYSFTSGPVSGPAISAIATEHGDYSYSYDPAYRVKDTVRPDGEEHYTYDDLGRRQPASAEQWSYSNQGAVTNTGTAQYSYDADGNRTTKTDTTGETKFVYDESDRLVRVEKPAGTVLAEYHYDFFGRRMWKEVAGVKTYFYYNEDGLAAEFDSAGNVTKSYIFAPGSEWSTVPLALKDGSTYHYVHSDHLGVPQKLVKKNGAVTWEARYDLFGKANVINEGVINPLRLPGQYYDAETGLHQNLQRNYDPVLGAYLEQDPYGVLVTGSNRYHYAGGNPVEMYDPTGEIVPLLIGIGLVALYILDKVWTGFDAYNCFKALQDNCANLWSNESCQNLAIGAVVGAVISRVALRVFRIAKPYMRPVGRYAGDVFRRLVHGDDFFKGTKYTEKVLNQMELGDFHSFPESVRAFQDVGKISNLKGGDNINRKLLEIPGSYKGRDGSFQFIKEKNGSINHRLFKPE